MAERGPELPQLPGVHHRDVDAGGVRLHLAEAGPPDASPLLLVHGWPQHWWCWRRVVPRLAERFRCLLADLRGHGWSQAPARGYDKEQLVSDLLALLDRLEIERAGYVGHDWGAYCGYLAAMRAPERLTGVLALGCPHLWPSWHDRLNPRRVAAFAYQIPLIAPVVSARLLRRGLVRRVLAASARDGTFDATDLELYDAIIRTDDGVRVTQAMYRTFVTREAPGLARGGYSHARVHLPVRVVLGERDILVRGADLGGYHANVSDMTVETVPGAGHFLPEEVPELVVERTSELFG
jgi:pimeloyl-ACP methyl ester carboxylesterase